MFMKFTKNIKTVLKILHDEVTGDTTGALQKMCPDYTMTWMYLGKKKLFPSVKVTGARDIDDVYVISGREYEILNIAEGDSVVFVELVESYPDPDSGQIYRTPLILVLEMKRGKIRTGRHYCDPRLSYMSLTKQQIRRACRNPQGRTRTISAKSRVA